VTLPDSEKTFEFIKHWRIPITPKFWEQTFGTKDSICFQALRFERLDSLFKRQHKKNQVSTFLNFKNTDIFWGPGGLWKDENLTIIAILKGKVTVHSETDLWSFPLKSGRRWIDVKSLISSGTLTTTAQFFYDVQQEVKHNFRLWGEKKYPDELDFNKSKVGNIIIKTKKLSNKDKYNIIKNYYDISYDSLKKHKKRFDIKQITDYDELLCYDYEVKELIIIVKTNDENTEIQKIKAKVKNYAKIPVLTMTQQEAQKYLKRIQNEI
jgi:hypothetical protein